MNAVNCTECDVAITLAAGTEVGEIIVCPDCGVDLEVTSLNPAQVNPAPMEQEDWGE
jgi:alpha-aminoadipate carrier protein LysW